MAPWRPYTTGTNLLTKFYEDPTINVAATVLKRQIIMSHNGRQTIDKRKRKAQTKLPENPETRVKKTPPPSFRPCFLPIQTIFELNCRIQETNVLTKFHEDWEKNGSSRLFKCFHCIHIEKTAPPPGGHVFPPIMTIFELVRDINKTNDLTKFHDDWTKIVTSIVFTRNTAPPPGGHLHEDWASNVTSTVFTSFELSRGINWTHVLTKFHEDRTINVASRVFTRQNVDAARRTTHDGKKAITKRAHGELKSTTHRRVNID
ncbi:hypothetical protein DPMN_115476 [Dreissena polymorpha]|uniref:Uncharacterized protein n=1 Tax=Dreissena polymorpha TaxID=45954 RepID=A0A9D4KLB8_DREPO|nr:hypothetical protein DPMN_115476 [Dreissena polymorpha]